MHTTNNDRNGNTFALEVVPGFSDRLSQLVLFFNDIKDAANSMNLSEPQLRRIIKGESSPRFLSVATLAGALGASLDWLAYENRPMFPESSTLPARNPFVPKQSNDFSSRFSQLIESAGGIDKASKMMDIPPKTTLGFLKNASSVSLLPAARLCRILDVQVDWLVFGTTSSDFLQVNSLDSSASFISLQRSWARSYLGAENLGAVLMNGDSMEPTIKDGDLILLDLGNIDPADGMFAVRHWETVAIKRLSLSWTNLHISGDNPKYKPFEIKREELSTLEILGKVVWYGRRP